jgi:hypothetical protein
MASPMMSSSFFSTSSNSFFPFFSFSKFFSFSYITPEAAAPRHPDLTLTNDHSPSFFFFSFLFSPPRKKLYVLLCSSFVPYFFFLAEKEKKNVSLCTTLFRRPVVCVTPSMAINSQWSIGGLGYDIRWKKKKRVFWNL